MKLNLTTTGKEQEILKQYLEENASDVLAEKINNGVLIEKDGKKLLNKKTLDGFMKFAYEEAKKQAVKGANCACIEDRVVFGWVIHYFEEESIIGTLYNEDGTEYKEARPAPKTTAHKAPIKEEPKEKTGQLSMFDLFDEPKEETTVEESEEPEEVNVMETVVEMKDELLTVNTSTGEVINNESAPEYENNDLIEIITAVLGEKLEIVR